MFYSLFLKAWARFFKVTLQALVLRLEVLRQLFVAATVLDHVWM